jgi:hypothetical protein
MPPQMEKLSRRFSRNANGLLTMVGHGRRLIIADSSFDPPDRSVSNDLIFYYLGNREGDLSAGAVFNEISKAYPVEQGDGVRFMLPDHDPEGEWTPDQFSAPNHNKEVITGLGFSAIGIVKDGPNGFYEFANSADSNHAPLVCFTGSELSFDCIATDMGHLQVPTLV